MKRKTLLALSLLTIFSLTLLWPRPGEGQQLPSTQVKEEDPKVTLGGFGARRGALKEKMLERYGGNKESEAAVSLGLEWLVLHQAADGSWSMDAFHKNSWDKLGAGAKRMDCDCKGPGNKNDIAGTAFGLLPLLGAGHTHKAAAPAAGQRDFSGAVLNGLKYLMSKQGKDGNFGGGTLYAHGIAAIAMCEAYGMTLDPALKGSAQAALNFIITAQHEQSGGWRYQPKQSGDTSVTGWQVMALKSGQMYGLNVPATTFKAAEKWLDSAMDKETGAYGYTSPKPTTPTMTAVGLLCREYMGWNPRKPELAKGSEFLAKTPPGQTNNIYHYYYATQAMHHVGGEKWKIWNEGVDGKKGMRDLLIDKQNKAGTGHKAGSWDPQGDVWNAQGGRLMITSLSLLILEVYYRHVPLYQEEKKE